MAWSHSFLLFLAKGCDPLRMLNILQPSFLQFVQFTAQQLLVICPALTKKAVKVTAFFPLVARASL